MAILSSFAQKHGQALLSPDDPSSDYLINKLVAGDNISIAINVDEEIGQQMVFSAGQKKIVQTFNADGAICKDAFLVLIDASKSHVKLTLPVASSYTGQLSVVCLDPTNGIELHAESGNSIFDETNMDFKSKGDAITLVSDGILNQNSIPAPGTGTWYCVGKYTANWYA